MNDLKEPVEVPQEKLESVLGRCGECQFENGEHSQQCSKYTPSMFEK